MQRFSAEKRQQKATILSSEEAVRLVKLSMENVHFSLISPTLNPTESADFTDALSTCTPRILQFAESMAFSKCTISEMQLVGNRWHPNNSSPDLTATLFLGEVVLRIQIGCLVSRESEKTKSPSLHVYHSKNEEDMDLKFTAKMKRTWTSNSYS